MANKKNISKTVHWTWPEVQIVLKYVAKYPRNIQKACEYAADEINRVVRTNPEEKRTPGGVCAKYYNDISKDIPMFAITGGLSEVFYNTKNLPRGQKYDKRPRTHRSDKTNFHKSQAKKKLMEVAKFYQEEGIYDKINIQKGRLVIGNIEITGLDFDQDCERNKENKQ